MVTRSPRSSAPAPSPRRSRRTAAGSSGTSEGKRGTPRPRTPHKAPNNEWWRGGVIYQIYPRSFQDSRGHGVGDLNGITQRLEYVKALGVDAIWLSPFFKSPMRDFGYDVSDYRAIDPIFGTLDDFRTLVDRAHALGLKVIIDQVLSHSSDEHPWFIESRQSRKNPKSDWYVWADAKPDGSPPNNWQSVFGGSAWHWDTRRMQYYLHNFLSSQPDLNFHNRKVQDALLADMRFWLELGVDGFRLDTVNYYFHSQTLRDNPPRSRRGVKAPDPELVNPYDWQRHVYDQTQPENLEFLKRLRALLDQFPNTTTVGEVGADDTLEVIAQYTADGDKLHMAYSFDLLYEPHSAEFLHQVFGKFGRIVKDGWPSWAISNHDCPRIRTRWGGKEGGEAVARLAAVMQMTLRGSPCIYQGDELGLPEVELSFEQLQDPYGIRMWPEFKGRDGCRTPFPWKKRGANAGFSDAPKTWLPIPPEHRELAVDQQTRNPDSMLNFYRNLLAWRKTHPALVKGRLKLLPANPQLLGYERRLDDDALLCVFNFSGKKARLPLPRGWADGLIDEGCGLTGAEIRRGALVLAPWSGAVLVRP